MLNLDAMNFTKEDIITIDNFLEFDDFNKTLDLLARPKWQWGHGSNPNNLEYSTPFWKMELTSRLFTARSVTPFPGGVMIMLMKLFRTSN